MALTNNDPIKTNPSLKVKTCPKLKFPYIFPFALLLVNLLQISRKVFLDLLILHDVTRVLTASANLLQSPQIYRSFFVRLLLVEQFLLLAVSCLLH